MIGQEDCEADETEATDGVDTVDALEQPLPNGT